MNEANLQERLAAIRERIAAAAKRAGRTADEITLVAVSKTHSADAIRAAFEQGIGHFGENRVQEWEGKRDALQDLQAEWHLVGHLQSNKAAKAARFFHSVDSMDDFALAQRLDRARAELGESRKLRVLIEVRIAPEESKSGVTRDLLVPLADQISGLSGLDLRGLMCIPPFLADLEKVRPYFSELRGLKEDLAKRLGKKLPVLSMGMSNDFEVAIEEGATEVRIGTALFGARPMRRDAAGEASGAI
jgi:pyridoxal phosphate enzyme (YggS family)